MKLKLPLKLIAPLVLITLVILLVSAVMLSKSNVKKELPPVPSPSPSATTNIQIPKISLKDGVIKKIEESLDASSSAKVRKYLNTASSTEDEEQIYQNLLLVYKEIDKNFKVTKDPSLKLTEIRLQSYLSGLPKYKEEDFK